jgi:hypothetical protein
MDLAALKPGDRFVYESDYCVKTNAVLVERERNGVIKFINLNESYTEHFDPDYAKEDSQVVTASRAKPMIVGKTFKRSDKYEFAMFIEPNGKKFYIIAGCRCWTSFEDMTDHYASYRVEDPRWNMSKKRNEKLNAESLEFLAKFKARLTRYRKSLAKK